MLPNNHKVIVVGANVTGLMMAIQLIKLGVEVGIVDKLFEKPSLSDEVYLLDAYSVEILNDLEVDISKYWEDIVINEFNIFKKQDFLFSIASKSINGHPIKSIKRSYLEKALIQYLALHCCPIYWETHYLSHELIANRFICNMFTKAEKIQVQCQYLVFANKYNEKQLIDSSTKSKHYFEAEVYLNGDEFSSKIVFNDTLVLSTLSCRIENRFKLVGWYRNSKLSLEQIKLHIGELVRDTNPHFLHFKTYQPTASLSLVNNENVYYLSPNMQPFYSLTWDSVPNLALYHTVNLAWKIAGVLNKEIQNTILRSFDIEKNIGLARVKQLNQQYQNLFYLSSIKQLLVRLCLGKLKNTLLHKLLIKNFFLNDLHYRDSQINLHLSHSSKIKAGDFLPNIPVYLENKKMIMPLREWIKSNVFVLLILGYISPSNVFTMARWMKLNYPLAFFYLPRTEKNEEVFKAFSIIEGERKMLIIRPDKVIGLITDHVDIQIIDNYLSQIVGMNRFNNY